MPMNRSDNTIRAFYFLYGRLDTTLIDFIDMKCQRGDLSFIFSGEAPPSQSFVVLDNEAKVYQRIHHEVRHTSPAGDAAAA